MNLTEQYRIKTRMKPIERAYLADYLKYTQEEGDPSIAHRNVKITQEYEYRVNGVKRINKNLYGAIHQYNDDTFFETFDIPKKLYIDICDRITFPRNEELLVDFISAHKELREGFGPDNDLLTSVVMRYDQYKRYLES